MRNKKQDQAEPTSEQILEAKVDAMMDVSTDAPEQASRTGASDLHSTQSDALPPLDIFSDPKTAPEVPENLLQQIGKVEEKPVADLEDTVPQQPAELVDNPLDDAKSDAAIDEIEAQESDVTLLADDAEQQKAAAVTEPVERERKLHHHPIFWTVIFLTALVAMLFAYLLVTGGNVRLPGSGTVQHLLDTTRNKL